MKSLLLIVSLGLTACSSLPPESYLKVGTGYKFRENNLVIHGKDINDPISARIELGAQCGSKNLTCGISHHSQWMSGWPFNDDDEYAKTEIFIDYKFKLN